MAIEIKHKYESTAPDSGNTSVVQPSNWNDTHNLNQDSGTILGRTTAGNGPTEELAPSAVKSLLAYSASDVSEAASPSNYTAAAAEVSSHLSGIDGALGGRVSINSQTLTDTQKQQARSNVYAAPFDAMAYHGLQINGFQQHSQEHGTAAVGPGNRPVDEELFSSSNGTMTAQRVASPFLSRPDIPYGIELSVGTGAALGASDEIQVSQNIEGTRLHGKLAWGGGAAKPISIGRVLRSNISGRGYVSVRNVLVNRSLVYHFDLTADTDTYVQIPISGDTTGGWATDTTAGLVVTWTFGAGSNLTTGTLNTWQAANFLAGNDVTNFFSTTGNKVWLGPMVVLPGNDLPTFEEIMKCQRHFDDELRYCQRYYVRQSQAGVYTNDTIAVINGLKIDFPVVMRAAPSMSYLSGAMVSHHMSPPNGTNNVFDTGCTAVWHAGNYRNFTGVGWTEYVANARM